MLFLQKWSSSKWRFLLRCSSRSAIEIGLNRLTAIRLELEEQKERIRSLNNFRLSNSVSAEIQQFLDRVYRQIPPPTESTSSDQTMDSPSSIRGLIEVEMALKFELRLLQTKKHSVLTPLTMQSVHDAIVHLDRIQSSFPIDRDSSTALKAIHKQLQISKEQSLQKLDFAIEQIHSEAKDQISSLPNDAEERQIQSRNILKNSIEKFERLYTQHRSSMDFNSTLVLLDRIVSIAEMSGGLPVLFYTHGLFVSYLLKRVFALLNKTDLYGLNAFFWNIGKFGPKIRPIAAARLEIDEMLQLACNKAEENINQLSPSQIQINLRALSILKYHQCHELMEAIFRRMKNDVHGFRQNQLIANIRLCATLRLVKPLEFHPVLDAIDFSGIQQYQAENLLWSLPRLPAKPGSAYDPNIRRYLNQILCQFNHFLNSGVRFNATKVLWQLAQMSCFPGEELLNRLISEALLQVQASLEDLNSLLYALASLQYCPDDFLKEIMSNWETSYEMFTIQEACSITHSLNLLGKTEQEHLDLLRSKLENSDPKGANSTTFIRLAQIHVHCEKVLQLVSPVEGDWKKASENNRLRLIQDERGLPIAEDITDFLKNFGCSIKDSVPLPDVYMRIKSIQKDNEKYALEVTSTKSRIYGQKPVLRTKLLNRDQVLRALNIKVIRLDPEYWKTLYSEQQKLNYINEIFTHENNSPNIVPKLVEQALFNSWESPTKSNKVITQTQIQRFNFFDLMMFIEHNEFI
eukprot:g5356.t1